MNLFNSHETAYLEALFFTQSTPDLGKEYDLSEKSIYDFSDDAVAQIHADINLFEKLTQAIRSINNPDNSLFEEYSDNDQFWYDFWYTRNRLGTGFWETPDYPKEDGEHLTFIAEFFYEIIAYVDENGQIQLERN